jgi:5-methylcytosine-specific restriction enzyme A
MASSPYYRSKHWRDLRAQALMRDRYRCTVPGCRACCAAGDRLTVDHIETRPRSDGPTPADVLTNLRTLCLAHDAQIKERGSARNNAGRMTVRGCDANGWPLDPRRR